MPAFIDENQQFIDPDTSAPIVNGNVFFGAQGSDPQAVPIIVFVDSALTIPIAQPIKTDASGRTTQKIFIPARYSFKVTNSAGSQKLIDLNAGSTPAVGITILTNIAGANDITAQADPPITALVDGQQFTFPAAAINTDKMTLKIDGTPVAPIKFNFNEEMGPAFIQQNQTINLTFNGTVGNLHFAWVNDGRGISLLTNVGGTANAITADGGPSITGLVDGQQYPFKPASNNTGNTTLTIGTLPTTTIKQGGVNLVADQLVANKTAIVMFNSIGPEFELVSGGGTAVSPASATDGNVVKFGALPTRLVDSLVSSLGPLSIQSILGNGTWTRPANVKSVLVILTGSGGGGSGSSTSDAGGGGGAGATVIKFIPVAAPSYAVVIGAAGGGGAGGDGAGGDGADSTVGVTVVVAQKGFGAPSNQTGGDGGSTGTGDLIIAGASGNAVDDSTTQLGGEGGGSYWGGGGSRIRAATGGAGLAFGTGGAGGPTGGNFGGGPGKTGVAFFLEFG